MTTRPGRPIGTSVAGAAAAVDGLDRRRASTVGSTQDAAGRRRATSTASASSRHGARGPPRSVTTTTPGRRRAAPRPSPSRRSGAAGRRGRSPRARARGSTRRGRGRRRPRARAPTSTPMPSSESHTPRSSSPARRVPRGAHHRRRALLGQQVAHRVAERDLVVGPGEPHRRGSPRQALGGDVALDLVGAGVDRARQRELPALAPRALELGVGAEQVERDLVQLDVELATTTAW